LVPGSTTRFVALAERGRKPKKQGEQLGKADFEASPYAEIPRRKRARARIATPPPPSLDIGWYHGAPPPPEAPQPRRLSRKERRRIRKRREATAAPIPATRRTAKKRTQRRWGLKLISIVAVSVVLVTLGSERFFGTGGEGREMSTVTPTAVIGQVPSPVSTQATEVVVVLAPDTPTPEPTATPTPDPRFAGKVVCLDPGHGGSDRGYTRDGDDIAPAMEEGELNLAIALDLKTRLEAHGFTVVMTRDSDADVNGDGKDINGDGLTWKDSDRAKRLDELQARINICNSAKADLLVSMHLNGFPDDTAGGYETWYNAGREFSNLNERFATLAYLELGKQMGLAGYNATPRQVNDDSTAHAEIERDAFENYVITGPAHPGQIVPSKMPGAIVEALFISNDDDAAFMATDEGKSAIVSAYEQAIVSYFEETA
jgi:N-acetylmuramoyl-L-alanine amidase